MESGKGNVDYIFTHGSAANDESGQLVDTCKDLTVPNRSHVPAPSSSTVPDDISEDIATEPRSNRPDTAANTSWHSTNTGDGTNMKQLEEAVSVFSLYLVCQNLLGRC